MNIIESIKKTLVQNGMSDTQVNEVIKLATPELEILAKEHGMSLNGEYPNIINNMVYMYVKPIALKWIEENKPMAWFKPMFE